MRACARGELEEWGRGRKSWDLLALPFKSGGLTKNCLRTVTGVSHIAQGNRVTGGAVTLTLRKSQSHAGPPAPRSPARRLHGPAPGTSSMATPEGARAEEKAVDSRHCLTGAATPATPGQGTAPRRRRRRDTQQGCPPSVHVSGMGRRDSRGQRAGQSALLRKRRRGARAGAGGGRPRTREARPPRLLVPHLAILRAPTRDG